MDGDNNMNPTDAPVEGAPMGDAPAEGAAPMGDQPAAPAPGAMPEGDGDNGDDAAPAAE